MTDNSIYQGQTGAFQLGQMPAAPSVTKAAKTQQLGPQEGGVPPVKNDQVQTPSPQGSAQTVSTFVDSQPGRQLRSLISQGRFDEAEALLVRLRGQELNAIDLTAAEVETLAKGLGSGSWVPMSYTGSERTAVMKAIMASGQLSGDHKIALLKTYTDEEAVINFYYQASVQDLRSLSPANRAYALTLTDPGNSVTGTVKGALGEGVGRRLLGNSNTSADQLAARLLMATPGEADKRKLIAQLNQFNRDDAVYAYVMTLSPQQLAQFSDDFKLELLKHLVDNSIDLKVTSLDLNSLYNLDDVLGMVSAEHVQAARKLYVAMTPKAQQSQAVQQTINKSDAVMEEILRLRKEIQEGKVNAENIDSYTSQVAALKTTYGARPEILELEQTLNSLKTQIQQIHQTKVQISATVSLSSKNLTDYRAQIGQTRQAIAKLKPQADQAQTQLKATRERLLEQYEQLLRLKESVLGLGEEYAQLLQEFRATLQQGASQGDKSAALAKLQGIEQRLQAIEARSSAVGQANDGTQQQIQELQAKIQADRQQWNQSVAKLGQMQTRQQQLNQQLNKQIGKLEAQIGTAQETHRAAQARLKTLESSPHIRPADLTALKGELAQAGQILATQQTYLQETKAFAQNELQGEEKISLQEFKALTVASQEMTAQYAMMDDQLAEIASLAPGVAMMRVGLQASIVQMRESIEQWRSRLQDIKPEEIDALLAEMAAAKASLAESGGPERPELEKELTQIQGLYQDLKQQIQAAQTGQADLTQHLGSLTQARQNLSQSLANSTALVEQTQGKIANLQHNIATLQKQIGSASQQLSGYTDTVQRLKADWQLEQKTIEQLRQDFSNGKLDLNQLTQSLDKIELKQTAIDRNLREIGQIIGKLQAEIATQQRDLQQESQQLSQSEATLAQSLSNLQTSLTQFRSTEDQQRLLLERVDQHLGQLQKGVPNTALQGMIRQIQQGKDELVQLGTQRTEWIGQAEKALHHPDQKKMAEECTRLKQQLTASQASLDELKSNQLKTSKDQLTSMSQVLDAHQQEVRKATQAVSLLLNQLGGTGEPIQAHTIMETIDRLIQDPRVKSTDRQTMLEMRRLIHDLTGQISLNRERGIRLQVMDRAEQIQTQARTAREHTVGFQATLDALESRVQAAESQVSQTQGQILQMRQDLLTQRKALGVQSVEYQRLLAQYEAIVQGGGTPSAQDMRKLEQLEQSLSRIEAEAAQLDGLVEARLMAMNRLKEDINQQLTQLDTESATLRRERDELAKAHTALRQSYDGLQRENDQLKSNRQELHQKYTELVAMEQGGLGNLQEVRELRVALEAELKHIDQEIQQNDQTLTIGAEALQESAAVLDEMNQSLARAESVRSHLTILQAHIREIIGDLHKLKLELGDFRAQLAEIQLGIKGLQAYAPEPAPRPTQPHQSAQPEESKVPQDSPSLGARVARFLNQPVLAGPRPETASREKERERFLKMLGLQLEQTRLLRRDLQEQMITDQEQEQLISQLIQQAYAGDQNTSGVHIVGLENILAQAKTKGQR